MQEQLKQEEVNVKQWKSKCEEFNQKITKWKSQCVMLESEKSNLREQRAELAGKLERVGSTIELECYRAEAKVRRQWEAREDRLVQQLHELQHRIRIQVYLLCVEQLNRVKIFQLTKLRLREVLVYRLWINSSH